jgi:voltage-gated potassium channel
MQSNSNSSWRDKLHEIIFEADTRMGKLFDIILICLIIMSVIAVMLDSVAHIRLIFGDVLYYLEWMFTIVFTIEYILRLISVGRPLRYATSFYGIIDLLAIVPTYFSVIFPGSQYLLVIRILRLLRIFRVLKMAKYLNQSQILVAALKASRRKITVFLFVVLLLAVIFGSMIYVIEGEQNGFTSIPRSIYWAIVTLTTVGYGDISPKTGLGQAMAAIIMIMGYGIIAVPTGIVSVELAQAKNRLISTLTCSQCSGEGHDDDAVYCKYCGDKL